MGPPDHVRFEEVDVADVCVSALEFAHVFDLLQFLGDEWRVGVAFAMNKGQDGVAFLPTVLPSEPARRLGREAETQEEQKGGDHLQSPRQTEGCRAVDEAGSVGDVEHDHDAPGDGPLLSTDQASTLAGRRQFADVDRHLSTRNAHTEAVDKSAHDQHPDILRGADENAADEPDPQSLVLMLAFSFITVLTK